MLKEDFETFCSNIQLDNIEEMNTTIKEITKKLNKHYYDMDDDNEHMYKVGSVGRGIQIMAEVGNIQIHYQKLRSVKIQTN